MGNGMGDKKRMLWDRGRRRQIAHRIAEENGIIGRDKWKIGT